MEPNLVAGDHPQPSPKRIARPLPAKAGDAGGNGRENVLQQIIGVLALQAAPPEPGEQQRSIEIDQPLPGIRVVGLDPLQQAEGRDVGAGCQRLGTACGLHTHAFGDVAVEA